MSGLQTAREHLVKTNRHIAGGEQRIAAQLLLTEQLRAVGRDVSKAERLLLILRQTLETWSGYRDLIVQKITRLEARVRHDAKLCGELASSEPKIPRFDPAAMIFMRCAGRPVGIGSVIDHPPPDDRKPVEVSMPLPPATSRLVALELRLEAATARMRGDLLGAAKLRARADALCPPSPPALQ